KLSPEQITKIETAGKVNFKEYSKFQLRLALTKQREKENNLKYIGRLDYKEARKIFSDAKKNISSLNNSIQKLLPKQPFSFRHPIENIYWFTRHRMIEDGRWPEEFNIFILQEQLHLFSNICDELEKQISANFAKKGVSPSEFDEFFNDLASVYKR